MSAQTTALPTWDELSDPDKGAVLLHLWKRNWEGAQYAIEEYPARFFDDARLTALPRREACRYALAVGGSHDLMVGRLGEGEHNRLYNVALGEPDRRCLWAARNPVGAPVCPVDASEAGALELLAYWAEYLDRDWVGPGYTVRPTALLRRDEPGGEWVEVPL